MGDSDKPFVGMTNFKGNYITEDDVKMQDWVAALDNQIVSSQRKILEGNGKISHEDAMEKATHEYNRFRQKELANLKSDFDLFLEETKKLSK